MLFILNQLWYFVGDNQVLKMACLFLYNIIINDPDDDMEEGDAEVEGQEEEQRQPVPERTLGLHVCADLMAKAPGRLDRVRHP